MRKKDYVQNLNEKKTEITLNKLFESEGQMTALALAKGMIESLNKCLEIISYSTDSGHLNGDSMYYGPHANDGSEYAELKKAVTNSGDKYLIGDLQAHQIFKQIDCDIEKGEKDGKNIYTKILQLEKWIKSNIEYLKNNYK